MLKKIPYRRVIVVQHLTGLLVMWGKHQQWVTITMPRHAAGDTERWQPLAR